MFPRFSSVRRRSLLASCVVLAVTALLLAACGGGGDEKVTAATTTKPTRTTAPPSSTTSTTIAAPIAPLTGAPDPTGGSATRGALAVKIDNVPGDGRPPQAGIEDADVVYEEPVEGTTRLLSIFQSKLPARVGPVRSTRFIDPGIVWHLGGLYVFSGGTPPKVAAIKAAPVQTIDENGLQQSGARIRDPNARAPHNLFAVPDKIWAWDQIRDRTPPAPLFEYLGASEQFPGTPASAIAINNDTRAKYTWDAAGNVWKREALIDASRTVKPHLAESGRQVTPANVIVQRIAGLEDKSVMVGEGDATVCSQGRCASGKWRRPSLDVPTTFHDATGTQLRLQPGSTWVHIVTGGSPTITP